MLLLIVPQSAEAGFALESRVNEAFRGAFEKNPTRTENDYWRGRVVRREKKTFNALLGAMFYHKALGKTIGNSSGKTVKVNVSASAKADTKK